MANNNQITERGIAQQSGLEVFSSITNYTGEYVNWGYGDEAAFNTASAYTTTAANPYTDSLINNPPSTLNAWYIYYTSGSPWTAAQAPASGVAAIVLYGQKTGGNASYSGIYQKLSLIAGKEYQISIDKFNYPAIGSVIVQVYTPSPSGATTALNDYSLVYDSSFSAPIIGTTESTFTDTFTAQTANDILMISFTTDYSAGMAGIALKRISVQEKQEYLVPLYAEDKWGNEHKVLRRNLGNPNLNA